MKRLIKKCFVGACAVLDAVMDKRIANAMLPAVVAVYMWNLLPILLGQPYAPVFSDEIFYFLDARSFALHGHPRSALLFEEYVSKIGDAYTHGAAYQAFFGLFAALGIDDGRLFPLVNALILCAVGVMTFFAIRPARLRAAVLLCLLLHSVTYVYAFTYMVETLNAFFALALSILLGAAYISHEKQSHAVYHISAFIFLIVLFSLFRISYALWTLALLPLAGNRRQFIVYTGIFTGVAGWAVMVRHFFCAPFPWWTGAAEILAGQSKFQSIGAMSSVISNRAAMNLIQYFIKEQQGSVFYFAAKYIYSVTWTTQTKYAFIESGTRTFSDCA